MSENEMDKEVRDQRPERIKAIVEEIRAYRNPEELEELKKIIRKNVPLTMRGYFMAYLFASSKTGRPEQQRASRMDRKPTQKQVQNANPDSVSLYVNVGKISKLTSKDLAAFICENASLREEDILSIAFKQNYSFVYINKDKADAVMASVNGKTLNGRKVKVSVSRESNASAE